MDISLEVIQKRTSVRTYDGTPLTPEEMDALRLSFQDCGTGPFGGRVRFMLVGSDVPESAETGRLGTYGVIRRAPSYILGVISEGPFAFEDFGYCMQGIVLAAAALGLGTCWLGGALDRGAAAKALGAGPKEIVPAITPIGRAADRRGFVDAVIRGSAGSSKRKPWGELFFDGSFQTPLAPQEEPWTSVLECVRLGPSASNKQPWRVVREEKGGELRFHLYLQEDAAYNRAMGNIRLQNIDMGIAMRQFEAAARALNLPGTWKRLERDPLAAPTPMYIASWLSPR